jgi:hypothetical protein
VALAVVIATLACTACSPLAHGKQGAAAPAPTGSAAPAAPASTSPANAPSHDSKLSSTKSVGRSSQADVNGYCRAWYVAQKTANVRYPTSGGDHSRLLLLRSDTRRLVGRLDAVRPPPSESAVFQRFVTNERALVRVFADEASSDPGVMDAGVAAFNRVVAKRHAFAATLDAGECDGLLPRSQSAAAVRATRRFDVTTNPHEGCVSLVTPEYIVAEWGDTPDPMETCLQDFRIHRQGTLPIPNDIHVQSVTGVENLQATVTFDEVPDCGCGALVARLYLEHGRWLVSDVSYG